MNNPFIIGNRIYLRPISEADLTERYRDWFNDAEICKGNSHHRFPNYKENMNDYFESTIRSHSNLILAIVDKETDLHIGNISLQEIDLINRSAEFAIIIGEKKSWKQGIGKEAAQLLISHGFKELNLHRIYLGTISDNIGMQKLALSLCFREEGHLRDAMWKNGKWQDVLRYAVLENEWKF